ncbi:hypothetical protein D9M72_477230 [compost metagenome]
MTDQHQVEAGYAKAPQGRHHHPLADIEVAPARSGIIEQRVLAGTHQHGKPLSHIQHPHLGLAGRKVLLRREQRRHQQRQAKRA